LTKDIFAEIFRPVTIHLGPVVPSLIKVNQNLIGQIWLVIKSVIS